MSDPPADESKVWAAAPEPIADPEPGVPELCFDEDEVARLAARAAASAGLQARHAAREELAGRELAILERLADWLARERDARVECDRLSRRQAAQLAVAVARVFGGGEDPGGSRALGAIKRMLDALPQITAARLIADPATVAALGPRMGELERLAGFPLAVEAASPGQMPPGSLQLLWEGGWAEHDPADMARQIERLLAAEAEVSTDPESHEIDDAPGAAP